MSGFRYEIPRGLEYYDLPKVSGLTTRVFVEKRLNGTERHYKMVFDDEGNEVV